MREPIRLLRFAYWYGAVADAAMVLVLLMPQLGAVMFGWQDFEVSGRVRYIAAVGAVLMAGWTALLVWADRRPVERRGVLLLTAVPVVVAMMVAGAVAVATGVVEPRFMAPTFAFQLLGTTVFLLAYLRASAWATQRPGIDR